MRAEDSPEAKHTIKLMRYQHAISMLSTCYQCVVDGPVHVLWKIAH